MKCWSPAQAAAFYHSFASGLKNETFWGLLKQSEHQNFSMYSQDKWHIFMSPYDVKIN